VSQHPDRAQRVGIGGGWEDQEQGRGAHGRGRRGTEARVGVDAELPHHRRRINRPGRTDRGLRGGAMGLSVGGARRGWGSGGLGVAIDLPSRRGGSGAAGEEQPDAARRAALSLLRPHCWKMEAFGSGTLSLWVTQNDECVSCLLEIV
jgi:hypothetical protein